VLKLKGRFFLSKLLPYCLLSLSAFIFFSPSITHSQFFVKVTDPANPIVSEILSGNYYGASWVDVDGDERLDLFICRKDIFRNLGNGNFVKMVGSIPFQGTVIGNSWSDYDNDGDIDLFVISSNQSSPYSHLYRNDGSGMFTKITQGQIGDSASNTGWGCVWGDINNDSYTDLFLAAAYNFGGVLHPNRLFTIMAMVHSHVLIQHRLQIPMMLLRFRCSQIMTRMGILICSLVPARLTILGQGLLITETPERANYLYFFQQD
jgi:hypothetical protein